MVALRISMSVTLLWLAACAMGPDYKPPKVPAPETFRMAEKEGESIANLPWWELLRDAELQRLVRIALQENKDLMVAVASVEEFQARLYSARIDYLGNWISGAGSAGRMRRPAVTCWQGKRTGEP